MQRDKKREGHSARRHKKERGDLRKRRPENELTRLRGDPQIYARNSEKFEEATEKNDHLERICPRWQRPKNRRATRVLRSKKEASCGGGQTKRPESETFVKNALDSVILDR
jgi:hypothetical protein